MCTFYEASALRIISKFPFKDQVIKDLAVLDPTNTSVSGIIQLATRFIYFFSDDLDCLSMEFRDFRSTSMDQIPAYDSHESGAIDHFWASMAEVCSVSDLETYRLPCFVKISTSNISTPSLKCRPRASLQYGPKN